MSKTDDIESAILDILSDGPKTNNELVRRLWWIDDRRWIGIAINLHLVKDGQAKWTSCDPDHNHGGACVLERVTR